MKLTKRVTAALTGAASILLIGGLSTSAQAAPAAPAAAPCNQGTYCWWSGTGYSGSGVSYTGDLVSGTCYLTTHVGSVRSYAHYHRQEGYFYSNNNCTGSSRAVVANSESTNIGFNAYSFRAACVSCLAKEGEASR